MGDGKIWPTSINSDGVVVGHYGVQSGTNEITHPFLWTHAGGMKDLGFAVGQEGNAKGVNDAGRILIHELLDPGDCMCPDPENSIYLIRSVTSGEVIRTITASTRIEECMLGPDDFVVLKIETLTQGLYESLRWSPKSGYEIIGEATGRVDPVSINSRGWIVVNASALPEMHFAFLWTPESGMKGVGPPGLGWFDIQGFNNLDQVLISDGTLYCIWEPGNLESIPGVYSNKFVAASMNNVGEIVGTGFIDTLKSLIGELIEDYAFRHPQYLFKIYDWTSDWNWRETYAAIWFNGGLHSLEESLVNGGGWRLEQAIDINDNGQIIGVGKYKGKDAGFILDPVE